jgi:hypothetical protein
VFIVLLIPLTLGWKLTRAQQAPVESTVVGFLSKHKFDVTVTEPMLGTLVVSAKTGTCRMLVAEMSPDGANRSLILDIFKTMDSRFVVFRGKIYSDLPSWQTAAQDVWSRSLRMIGIADRDARVIAVGASEHCDAERLPWGELYESGSP